MARQRAQIVIGLGEGAEGDRLRKALDRAAQKAGKLVTVWAREQLLIAIGEAPEDPIVEVKIDTTDPATPIRVLVDLSKVVAIRVSSPGGVEMLLGDRREFFTVENPEEVVARWRRLRQ